MSSTNFSIFQDTENRDAIRKGRNQKPKPVDQKRLPLGMVNENTSLRVQQPRGAKQQRPGLKTNDENTVASKKISSPRAKVLAACKEERTKKEVCATLKQLDQIISKDVTKSKIDSASEARRKVAEAARIEERKVEEVAVIAREIEIVDLEVEDVVTLEFEDPELIATSTSKSDSIIGSPMSVDRSIVNLDGKTEQQLAEEQFYQVTEYQQDIYVYMIKAQDKFRPKAGYMRKQPDITFTMRSILVDWLVEVADEYNLHSETLFLAVSYIDRFLSYMSVVRGKLQLVGTAAMFIASKFEEIYPPDVNEFVYITDDTYTKKQVLRMEHLILKVLGFEMANPTILRFATKFNLAANSSESICHLTQYLCELSLLDGEKYMNFLPSEMAAAATALARHTLGSEAWPRALQDLTGYSLAQLGSCLDPLTITFADAASYPQQAVREKFKLAKWNCVGLLTPLEPTLVSLLPKPAAEITPKKECAKNQ
ncbi:G2/mitotic-specific cyclin-A-like [Cloeon dipterum]|uniref:G2/mitotic-specific cyclin-A-like n=1 Tax=Cloeon dipterum TaxID=197152 RepID=UPI0032207E33